MRRVARDENAPLLVAFGHRDAQIPEADMIHFAGELESRGLIHHRKEIEVLVADCGGGHRRVEKPAFANVDSAEELPVSVQLRAHDAIGRALGKALEGVMQFARAEDGQHHHLVEIGAAALDARLVAHHRIAAVAADDVIGAQRELLRRPVLLDDDFRAGLVLRHRPRHPAEVIVHAREARHLPAQHFFGAVLGQAVIVLVIIGAHHFAAGRREPVLAHEIAVSGDFPDGIARRHGSRRAQFVGDAPEMEVLQRALGKILPLGNVLQRAPALDERTRNAAHSQSHRERGADGAAAHNNYLVILFHALPHFFNPATAPESPLNAQGLQGGKACSARMLGMQSGGGRAVREHSSSYYEQMKRRLKLSVDYYK